MRGVLSLAALASLLLAARPAAALPVIYFDDFHQFSAGGDLTTATYVPTIGAEASFGSFGVGETITATAIGGNIAARWDLPPGTAEDYIARFGAAHVEEVLDLTFRFEVLASNSGFGGFFIRFPTPTLDMQLLAGFLDDGRLVVFTDTPSMATLESLPSTYLPGHTYEVRLRLDLPANQYSWFLDGTPVVTGRALPPHINAHEIHQFGFDASETLGGLGNVFVVDDVRAEVVAAPEPASVALFSFGVSAFHVARRLLRRRRDRA